MGLEISCLEGQTPLDEEEKEGLLIHSITTRAELDEFEQKNIEKAVEWTINGRFKAGKLYTEEFVKKLHQKMFNETWKWAGEFRKTNKNIGGDWKKVGIALRQLNDDGLFWTENKVFEPEELIIRYKHRLVNIHCFPNGNCRHSRLMADVMINSLFNKQVFSWGGRLLHKKGEARARYLEAIRKADEGNLKPLLKFARS